MKQPKSLQRNGDRKMPKKIIRVEGELYVSVGRMKDVWSETEETEPTFLVAAKTMNKLMQDIEEYIKEEDTDAEES